MRCTLRASVLGAVGALAVLSPGPAVAFQARPATAADDPAPVGPGSPDGASFVGPQTPAAPAPPSPNEPAITKLPVLKKFVEATYPERARAEGVEAVVVLDIDIDTRGVVEKVEVVNPAAASGYGFEDAALAAVAQFEFEPAEAGGVPIPVRITYKYGFALAPAVGPTGAPQKPAVVNFEGHLVERGTRAPLAGKRVTVFRGEGEAFEALSDARGRFQFFDLALGDWKVLVEADGYFPFRTTETIAAGERLDVSYYVERTSYNPNDVLVEGKRPRKEMTRRTLAVEEIDQVPGTFGDPVSVVTNLPSVARPPMGLGLIIVRGSSPEDTRFSIDGIDVPQIYHFAALRSIIPTGVLEMVDFYPGNFSAAFGRAMGGILDVRLKRLDPERVSGYVDVSVLDTGVYVEAPLGDDAAVAVAARRSYIDFVLDAAIPDDANVGFSTAPRYYDMQLLASYRPTRAQRLELFALVADDRMKLVMDNPADVDARFRATAIEEKTSFYRAILRHSYSPGGSVENDLSLAAGNDHWRTFGGDQFLLDIEVLNFHVRERLRLGVADSLALTAGVDYTFDRVDANVRSEGFRPMVEGDHTVYEDPDEILAARVDGKWHNYPAPYVEAEWKPVDSLLVIPGLRVDRFGFTRDTTVAPRLTVRWSLAPTVTAKAGVGLFHQEPMLDQLADSFGNPDLTVERATHYSLGAEWRPLEHLGIDLTAFYKDMDDLVVRSNRLVTRKGELVPEVFSNEGEGRVYGADLLIRHELANNFFGWLAYTLSRSERREPGARHYRRFDFDQTHVLTAVASYRLPRNWELGLRWRYTTGNPYTSLGGGVFASDLDTYQPVSGRLNASRLGAFHQLDVRIDKRWIYDGWMLNAYIDLQNSYGRTNPELYEYNYDYTQNKPMGGLPIIPVLGLRAEL